MSSLAPKPSSSISAFEILPSPFPADSSIQESFIAHKFRSRDSRFLSDFGLRVSDFPKLSPLHATTAKHEALYPADNAV